MTLNPYSYQKLDEPHFGSKTKLSLPLSLAQVGSASGQETQRTDASERDCEQFEIPITTPHKVVTFELDENAVQLKR